MTGRQYQVAISFAGEQRSYAEAPARQLSQYGIAYFYDGGNEVALWGKNLAEEFQRIYSTGSHYVLMLISEPYITKQWCRHERRSAISEALGRDIEFILPVRFDEAWPQGIPTDVQYVSGTEKTPPEVAAMIAQKLGLSLYSSKASEVPPPNAVSWLGDAAFDYESFNGRYVIGKAEYAFETVWTNAGPDSIHTYNNGANINGVAVAHGIDAVGNLKDASALDFSSRVRTADAGNIVVFRNQSGVYAALKIESVRVRSGTIPAELRFWYAINREGGTDFRDYAIFDQQLR